MRNTMVLVGLRGGLVEGASGSRSPRTSRCRRHRGRDRDGQLKGATRAYQAIATSIQTDRDVVAMRSCEWRVPSNTGNEQATKLSRGWCVNPRSEQAVDAASARVGKSSQPRPPRG